MATCLRTESSMRYLLILAAHPVASSLPALHGAGEDIASRSLSVTWPPRPEIWGSLPQSTMRQFVPRIPTAGRRAGHERPFRLDSQVFGAYCRARVILPHVLRSPVRRVRTP